MKKNTGIPDSIKSVKLNRSVKPVNSVKLVKSLEPAKSDKSAKSVRSFESVKPLKPVKSGKSAKSIMSAKSAKIAVIIACSLAALAAVLCLSPYLVMHRYISKVNYVPLEEADLSQTGFLLDGKAVDSRNEFVADASAAKGNGSSAVKGSLWKQDAVTASSESSITTGKWTTPSDSYDHVATDEATDSLDTEVDEVMATQDESACSTAVEQEAVNLLEERILKNISNKSDLSTEEDDVLNLLLISTDNRSEEEQGLSDSMLLLSISEKARKITMVSLLRDIYLHIPEINTFHRLNTSYTYGGARLLIKTIEENFKIRIDKYVLVDIFSLIEIIDSLGGIELDISEEEVPLINDQMNELNRIQGKVRGTDYLKESGVQQLNGRQAHGYARVHYVGTDFGRTAKQRNILEQLYKKAKKLGVRKTTQLMDILLSQVTTNFTEKEIISKILSLGEYMKYEYTSSGIPMEGTYENLKIRGMQILAINFEDNIKELRRLIYNNE